jgi:mRNA-degrading endonuclease RelE of RelBE toxin-antitoxin system
LQSNFAQSEDLLVTLRVPRQVRKELERLPQRIAEAIIDGLEDLDANPTRRHPQVKHLAGPTFRLRVGDYRAIFDRVGGDVILRQVGHRQGVNRR